MSDTHRATVLAIEGRPQRRMSRFASLDDFEWSAGEDLDTNNLLDDPNVSLYCLDDARQQAIFVELPPGVDLSQAPFYYLAQHQQALRLIAVPYAAFNPLADRAAPPPGHLILVHNIGRCGSTLVHHAFNEVESVTSLSEPDVFGNLVTMRASDEQRDPDLIRLQQRCVRVLFRTWPRPRTGVIKFRNQGMSIIDLVYAAFPQATHLFMYRNAVDWSASIYRLVTRSQAPPVFSRAEAVQQMQEYVAVRPSEVEALFDPNAETVTLAEFLAMEWVYMLKRCADCVQQGIPLLALRYEDLLAQPEPMLEALFRACDLPLEQVDQAQRAFSKDSQAGTRLARESSESASGPVLDAAQVAQIEAVLQRYPEIQTPNYVLPGSLQV